MGQSAPPYLAEDAVQVELGVAEDWHPEGFAAAAGGQVKRLQLRHEGLGGRHQDVAA